jgi:hypothetical protein
MDRSITATVLVVLLLATGSCRPANDSEPPMTDEKPRRPIEQVLAQHTPGFMAIPGVVGTAQGALESGEPCIQVLVASRTSEIERRIPRSLEGWPVVIVVTGEIRAMPGDR